MLNRNDFLKEFEQMLPSVCNQAMKVLYNKTPLVIYKPKITHIEIDKNHFISYIDCKYGLFCRKIYPVEIMGVKSVMPDSYNWTYFYDKNRKIINLLGRDRIDNLERCIFAEKINELSAKVYSLRTVSMRGYYSYNLFVFREVGNCSFQFWSQLKKAREFVASIFCVTDKEDDVDKINIERLIDVVDCFEYPPMEP